jgi:hypothetical protein
MFILNVQNGFLFNINWMKTTRNSFDEAKEVYEGLTGDE